MSRFLYLIRHAQAENGQHADSDRERMLKDEGSKEASAVGRFLQARFSNNNLIISSPATRTRTTALLIASEVGYSAEKILFKEQIYSGKQSDLINIINEIDSSVEHAIIVGHYPTIVELHDYLSSPPRYSMQPAELLTIKIETEWSEITKGCGTTVLQFHPGQL